MTVPESKETELRQAPLLPGSQELPSLSPELESKIRAFVNMLLDIADEKLRDNMEIHNV